MSVLEVACTDIRTRRHEPPAEPRLSRAEDDLLRALSADESATLHGLLVRAAVLLLTTGRIGAYVTYELAHVFIANDGETISFLLIRLQENLTGNV